MIHRRFCFVDVNSKIVDGIFALLNSILVVDAVDAVVKGSLGAADGIGVGNG